MFVLTTLTPSLLSTLHKYSKKAPKVTFLHFLDHNLVLVKLKVQKQTYRKVLLNLGLNFFCDSSLSIIQYNKQKSLWNKVEIIHRC